MTQLTNPTNEQELRKRIVSKLSAKLVAHTPLGDTEILNAASITAHLLPLITAHTNAEIAKVLDRFEQDCRLHYTTWGNSEKMLQVSGVLKHIQAERAKLKEVK